MDGDLFGRGEQSVEMARAWSMPNAETFSMTPVADFIAPYLCASTISVDPFARNKRMATYTNDLDPGTCAAEHLEAGEFLERLKRAAVTVDLAFFDPPYSPRQISEVYKRVGLKVGMAETQNAALYRRVRDAIDAILVPGGVVLSFGWNSTGMGISRSYALERLLLVQHGGAHNDTICIAERKCRRGMKQ